MGAFVVLPASPLFYLHGEGNMICFHLLLPLIVCKKSGYYLTDVFQCSFSNWPWCCKFDQWRRFKNYRFAGLPWDFSIQISNANDEVIYHCSSRKLPKSSWGIVCCPPSPSCQSYCTDISSSKIIFTPYLHLMLLVACFIWVMNIFEMTCFSYVCYVIRRRNISSL